MLAHEQETIVECCKVLEYSSTPQFDLAKLIKLCNMKCIEMDIDYVHCILNDGKLIKCIIDLCNDISNPFNTNESYDSTYLKKLVLSIAQFIANITAKGGPFLVILWNILSYNNFIGYQHIICACKRANSEMALEACIASIYNCMLKGYNNEFLTRTHISTLFACKYI